MFFTSKSTLLGFFSSSAARRNTAARKASLGFVEFRQQAFQLVATQSVHGEFGKPSDEIGQGDHFRGFRSGPFGGQGRNGHRDGRPRGDRTEIQIRFDEEFDVRTILHGLPCNPGIRGCFPARNTPSASASRRHQFRGASPSVVFPQREGIFRRVAECPRRGRAGAVTKPRHPHEGGRPVTRQKVPRDTKSSRSSLTADRKRTSTRISASDPIGVNRRSSITLRSCD